MPSSFQQSIENGEFVLSFEVVAARGFNEPAQEQLLAEAKRVYQSCGVQAISVADNPGGNPAILADAIATELGTDGVPSLVHFTAKDRNRNQIVSQLFALARRGVNDLLVMSGDYLSTGWCGCARPVFDLDSVQLLQLISEMNAGHVGGFGDSAAAVSVVDMMLTAPAQFFVGAAFNPYKWTEAEVKTQYYKLEKKILAGAKFAISQIGFDAQKMAEPLLYMREHGLNLPLIANIYVLPQGAARYFNSGRVAGCVVGDDLLATIVSEAAAENVDAPVGQKTKHYALVRAAKQLAIAKGLGYSGAHIGGQNLKAEDVTAILEMAKAMQADWLKLCDEFNYTYGDFYLYDREKNFGLPGDLQRNCLTGSLETEQKTENIDRSSTALSPQIGYDRQFVELSGIKYCPKQQLNGPCGGSRSGSCEVYEKQNCVYVEAYLEPKKWYELDKIKDVVYPPQDWRAG